MKPVTSWTRSTAELMHAEMTEALRPIAAEYGVTLKHLGRPLTF